MPPTVRLCRSESWANEDGVVGARSYDPGGIRARASSVLILEGLESYLDLRDDDRLGRLQLVLVGDLLTERDLGKAVPLVWATAFSASTMEFV